MTPFDLLVVTARDREQQWLFERRIGSLPLGNAVRKTLVVADPAGPQAGSGGSTLFALCAAVDALRIALRPGPDGEARLANTLRGKRVLLVHCGGFSQRIPQYASLGKAFAPAGHAAAEETLLEQVVRSLCLLGSNLREGVLVACGDVLYRVSEPARLREGVDAASWAWNASLSQASRHGVFIWDELTGRVTRTLQKASEQELRDEGFAAAAPLDTGVLYLAPPAIAALLAGAAHPERATARDQALGMESTWRGMDLYSHLVPALAGNLSQAVIARYPVLQALARFPLHAYCPEGAEFLHFGTTPELLDTLGPATRCGPLMVNSIVEDASRGGTSRTVLHHCRLDAPFRSGEGTVAVGLRSRRATVHLSDGRIAYQVPVTLDGLAGRATVLLGVDDDPKQSRGATLLGAAFTEWTGARGLDAELVWEGVAAQHRTLWNARVFPVIGARADPAESLDWLESGKGKSAHRRLSLAEIQGAFDARRWFAHETRIRSELSAREIAGALRENDAPVDRLAAGVPRPLRAPVLQALARHAARSTDRLQSARLWRGCAALAGVSDVGSEYHQRAFHSISVGLSEQVGAVPARRWNSVPGTMVEGSAPVRLDLAGGWTDTPPQACTEGGSVLNVALTLDGKLPLLARARILAEPVLRFIARDLRLERVCGTRAEVEACRDPADPFALHKAAVLEAGLVTPDVAGTLEELLLGAGGGLELETDSQVPKGSGLGTSSILGGVVLGCLFRLLDAGEPGGPDWRRLFGAVLRLEQRMTTGGGWQDQVGGLLPGFKLTQTGPGWDQTPSLFEVECAPEVRAELQARLVLFYTGLPRLARNVLQRVIDRYLAGEPVAIATLNRMRVLSHELREALVRGDLVQVGAGMTESWALNKRLEPTASNPEIEAIFAAAAPYVLGGKLAGAGGGGFAAFLTRSSQDAAELVTVLEKACPGGRCYPATISSSGLELRVCGAVAS